MITKQGIEPNPEKVKAIIDMLSPRTIREVQSLNGKLTTLDRFLERSTEKALPFFKTLKGCIEKRDFWWSQEAEEAFQKLKLHFQSLPALTVPIPGETLTLYLGASHETVSSVLMAEWEGIQRPIYFVSKAQSDKYYLRPENSGRLAKLAIELGEHDISYKLRSTVKGQVIADFLAECPNNTPHGEPRKKTTTAPKTHNKMPVWTLYTDGASGNEGAGARLILTDPEGNEITYALRFEFLTSNNESEYEALIAGLELSIRLEVHHLQVFTDSLLVTNHVKGTYEARE
ncbi:reverse transcriptase domain-containing protein [Tanacetum coccineum]